MVVVPVAVAGVWIRVSWRMIFALGPRRALACAAVSICSTLPTCMTAKVYQKTGLAIRRHAFALQISSIQTGL